ncbi:hypothetical protein L5849_10710 [Erythrobacter sp. SN021]|uniref:hypothetical protein n=1 Tax=Erythrobacter sp. SN021 TaxID=2912574 RepID=UPI001F3150F1|nr:hypothetical protein [Erythrobacter sp. SN021]MCF8883169.1 hypothetical protein [Erythrobacter sp. SN021]
MEKRGILLALLVTVLSGGIAAMIGAASLPSGSPYFDVLIYGGIASIAVSAMGLMWLALTSSRPDRQKPEEPEEPDVPDIRISQVGDAKISNVRSNTGRQFLNADNIDKISLDNISVRKARYDKKGKKGGR